MSWLFVVTDIVCIPSLDFTYSRAETWLGSRGRPYQEKKI
jgi:hypothetical protein